MKSNMPFLFAGLPWMVAFFLLPISQTVAQTSSLPASPATVIQANQAPTASPLVQAFLASRRQLVSAHSNALPALSQTISQAMNEALALSNTGQHAQALERINKLQASMPLQDIPSYDVQNFLAFLNGQLSQPAAAEAHRLRAQALREMLLRHVGAGTMESPLQLIMVSEVRDYARIFAGQPTGVKTEPRNGRELLVVTLQGMGPKEVVIEIDPRVRQASNANMDRYQAIPATQLRPEDAAFVERARTLREEFFIDQQFNYLALVESIRNQSKTAEGLLAQGRDADALAQLLEVQKIRPLEQIPSPRLLSMYSLLLGRTGNTSKQREMRGLIFGIQQVIAQSGDGSSPEKAFEVLMIDEEHDVLEAKKLKRGNQRLLEIGQEKFDVISTENAQGERKDMYFKITRMFSKYRL